MSERYMFVQAKDERWFIVPVNRLCDWMDADEPPEFARPALDGPRGWCFEAPLDVDALPPRAG